MSKPDDEVTVLDAPANSFDAYLARCRADTVEHGSGAIYERGLRDAALETEGHPVHPYQCPGCQRAIRSLEHDGYCRKCAGIEADEAELLARTKEARRQGERNTARLLHRLGHHDRAKVHEEEAERE
jgi:hypothetical protein